jgi:hypothetical protein
MQITRSLELLASMTAFLDSKESSTTSIIICGRIGWEKHSICRGFLSVAATRCGSASFMCLTIIWTKSKALQKDFSKIFTSFSRSSMVFSSLNGEKLTQLNKWKGPIGSFEDISSNLMRKIEKFSNN